MECRQFRHGSSPHALRSQLNAVYNDDDQMLFQVRVVPMGWSWAVKFIQVAHARILESALSGCPWLVDKRPGVDLSAVTGARLLYIDNFAVLSAKEKVASDGLGEMLEKLRAQGIRCKVDEPKDESVEILGLALDARSGIWRPNGRKFWRINGALNWLVSERRRVSGREVEKLLGHLTCMMMLRRELICLMGALYEFVRASYDKRQPLWGSCVAELRWIKGLLPTFASSMRRAWSPTILAYDASLFGYGVVESEWSLTDIKATGRLSEPARFKGPLAEAIAPRSAALDQAVANAREAELLFIGRAGGFTEVRRGAIEDSRWRTVLSGRWRRRGHPWS